MMISRVTAYPQRSSVAAKTAFNQAFPRFGSFIPGPASNSDGTPAEGSEIEQRISEMTTKIVDDRNRQTYTELQNTGFNYGGNWLTALTVLELLYNRIKRGEQRKIGLLSQTFSQMNSEHYTDRDRYSTAITELTKRNLIHEPWERPDHVYDLTHHNGSKKYYTITDLGSQVVERYHKDQKAKTGAVTKPKVQPVTKTKPQETSIVQALLEKSSVWGVTGIALLKTIRQEDTKRSWFSRFWDGEGVSLTRLGKALGREAAAGTTTLDTLQKLGFVEIKDYRRGNKWLKLTDEGKKVTGAEKLWETGIISAENMKQFAQDRIDACTKAKNDLQAFVQEHTQAHDKALNAFSETQLQQEQLEAEAHQLFAESKADGIEAKAAQEKQQAARQKLTQANQLKTSLEGDLNENLEQAAYELQLAQALNEKMSQDINTHQKTAQQEMVLLKMAIIQGDLAGFLDRWTSNEEALSEPINDMRVALRKKLTSMGIEVDPTKLKTQENVRKRMEEIKQQRLQEQLEATYQAKQEGTTAQITHEVTPSKAEAVVDEALAKDPPANTTEDKGSRKRSAKSGG